MASAHLVVADILSAKISPPSSLSNQPSYLAQVIKLISDTNFASVRILRTQQAIQIENIVRNFKQLNKRNCVRKT